MPKTFLSFPLTVTIFIYATINGIVIGCADVFNSVCGLFCRYLLKVQFCMID